jgi:hypothetical protein
MVRRRNRPPDLHPLGPEDDPYLAYLLWREERDGAQAEQEEPPAIPKPERRSWPRRLAVWRRGGDEEPRK